MLTSASSRQPRHALITVDLSDEFDLVPNMRNIVTTDSGNSHIES